MTLGRSIGYYTGIFSTAVTASVNPTATMAALSALGAIENASLYSPDSSFFNWIADALNGIPVLREAAKLPIANPYAAVFLTIVAAIMIVLHSFAESKIVSQATIDKIDKFTGWIGVTALSLMPLLTNERVPKTASAKHAGRVLEASSTSASSVAPWYVWVIGIGTLIIASIVYFCLYSCVDNIGTICAAIPVKGLNIVEQIVKAILHAGMILLQLAFPMLSFILSIIVAILGILLFRVLARISFYYKEVYIRPILHRIFRNGKEISRIHKKLPRRFNKRIKNITLALPVFAFRGVAGVPSRGALWFIIAEDGAHLMKKASFFRSKEISLSELKASFPNASIMSFKRFFALRTEDKQCNIVISRSNSGFIGDISSSTGFPVSEVNEEESNKKAGNNADFVVT